MKPAAPVTRTFILPSDSANRAAALGKRRRQRYPRKLEAVGFRSDKIFSENPKSGLDWEKSRPMSCTPVVPRHVSIMKIKAYLKPSCGWSNGVRAVMKKHGLAFEDIDIINHRANYAEMVAKSGQPLSPCVEIDGVMLADISGEEVENYLLSNDLVKPSDASAGTALNAGCSDEEHAKMATKTVRFF
jgi:monothiol glutaredoxin